MKPVITRVLRLLATLLILGAVFATSASPAGATSSKASVAASHATAASARTTAASAQTVVASKKPPKCTTFWCLHPNCHTYRCWHRYCHTWYCIHFHHIPPYGKHFKKPRHHWHPRLLVSSTALTQGGTLALTVEDATSVQLSLVGSNKTKVSLGKFSANSIGLLSDAIKLPAGLSGSYSLIAADAASSGTSSIPLFIAPAVSKLKAAPATKLASDRTANSNVGFSTAAVIGLGVLAVGMLGSGSTMLLLGRRRRAWRARG